MNYDKDKAECVADPDPVNAIPSFSIIFHKMGICSFCEKNLGKEAIGLNFLSTFGYFVCNNTKCKILSYNYKYFIIKPTRLIGIKEPFCIKIKNKLSGDEITDENWTFSNIKKTTYLDLITYKIFVLIEKNNFQREINISDLLKWNSYPRVNLS